MTFTPLALFRRWAFPGFLLVSIMGVNAGSDRVPEHVLRHGRRWVEFRDSKWTVTGGKVAAKRLKSNNMFKDDATTTGKFIIIRYKVLNKTKEEQRILLTPKLVDSRGREFDQYDGQAFYLPENAKTQVLEAMPASMSRTFWAVYEVAADSTGLRFRARELRMFGDTWDIRM